MDGNNYRQIFSTSDILTSKGRPTMSQGEKPPKFEEKWAVAIRALNRLISDAEAKRLLANTKLAQIVADTIEESSLPQLQTLSWLRSLLLRLSRCPPLTDETERPMLNVRRNPMNQELRIRLKLYCPQFQ
jgi:hypothetical protein